MSNLKANLIGSPNASSNRQRSSTISSSATSETNIEKSHYYSTHPQNVNAQSVLLINDVETSTVKFQINNGDVFTKTYLSYLSIADIKRDLCELFSTELDQVQLYKDEIRLEDNLQLINLGDVHFRIITLNVDMPHNYKLNKSLVYGYIPNVDVIMVDTDENNQLIVEIENQCQDKQWLGGFRNKITNIQYHNAATQTVILQCEKSNCGTNTGISIHSQTSGIYIPSLGDKIISVGHYREQNTEIITKAVIIIQRAFREYRTRICEKSKYTNSLTDLYKSIEDWYSEENRQLENSNNKERLQLLQKKIKLLRNVEAKKLTLKKRLENQKNLYLLSELSKSKLLKNKLGKIIKIDTICAQRTRELRSLFYRFKDPGTQLKDLITIVNRLKQFFENFQQYSLVKDVLFLLEMFADLIGKQISKGIMTTLQERIEKFIWNFIHIELHQKTECLATTYLKYTDSKELHMKMYEKILTDLQNHEVRKFKCYASVSCYKMCVSEMYYLVHVIWEDHSVLNSCIPLQELRMTRWNKTEQWTPWNCILLSERDINSHLQANCAESIYSMDVISIIKNKHVTAKIHFLKLLRI